MTAPDDWAELSETTENDQPEGLILNIDGFEGPLDLLLTMGRAQKVDLMNISILQLAEQYLAFVEQARAQRIALAADYLVMAAWLAFLKSRLLLPPEPNAEEPSGEEMAAHLAFQLERLSAMRDVAARLMARNQLGRDFFARGLPEETTKTQILSYDASLLDLMQAYARVRTKDDFIPYIVNRDKIVSVEDALETLRGQIGYTGDWKTLSNYLPESWRRDPFMCRSAIASTFLAALELVKQGGADMRQKTDFAPVEIRKRRKARD